MSYPIKIPLDEKLNAYLHACAASQVMPLGTLVNAWLIHVNREIGMDVLLNLNSDFPLFLNPPQNPKYKLALRVKDQSVSRNIQFLSEQNGRTTMIIYYSVLKALSSRELQKRYGIAPEEMGRSA